MNELGVIAAKTVGAGHCINVEKCPDGLFSKAFVLTTDNGKQLVAKVPNPSAGIPHYTTASEVATMDFMRNVLGTPVPQVHAWNFRADKNNPVGAEYIIMEKLPGIPLGEVWDALNPRDRVDVCFQVLAFQMKWLSVKFSQLGSLYYSEDVESSVHQHPLYINQEGRPVYNPRFAADPAVGREWVDDGRQTVQCDRGPWYTAFDYHTAAIARKKLAAKISQDFTKQLVTLYGPGTYQPTLDTKLAALDSYSQILRLLLPTDLTLTTGHLWHNDLHRQNVFVHPDKPSKILGIIDWQSTQILPLFLHSMDPEFLEHDGSDVGDKPQRTKSAKTDGMSDEGRTQAIRQYYDKCLMVAWRMIVEGKSPVHHSAIRFRRSTAGHILHISRNVSVMGEAHIQALLLDFKNEWDNSPSAPEFPLRFSETDVEEIEKDVENSCKAIALMNGIKEHLGILWSEKGLIEEENYDVVMSQLKSIKSDLIDTLVKSEDDQKLFEKYWPFDC